MTLHQEKIDEALKLIQNADPTSDDDAPELQTLEGLLIYLFICIVFFVKNSINAVAAVKML